MWIYETKSGSFQQPSLDFHMWIYETKSGTYKEDTLIKLLITIAKHRFHHLKNDGKWMD